jgi:hypothetical protein
VTKPATLDFEPDLALIERRLAARRQDGTFRPSDPLWVLFSLEEIQRMQFAEVADVHR